MSSLTMMNQAQVNDLKIFADNEISAGHFFEGQRLQDLIEAFEKSRTTEDLEAQVEELAEKQADTYGLVKEARELATKALAALKMHAPALDEALDATKHPPAKNGKKNSKVASVDKMIALGALADVAKKTQEEIGTARAQLEELIEKLNEAVTELV